MQNEAELQPCSPQVIEKLRLGIWIKSVSRLEFQQHNGLDDHVCAERSNSSAPKVHADGNFTFNAQSIIGERDFHPVSVHRFDIARSQFTMDLKERPEDSIADALVQQFNHTFALTL